MEYAQSGAGRTARPKSKISRSQKAAMEIAESLAEDLATNHPEVADYYRNGMTHREIAKKYGLDNGEQSDGMVLYLMSRTLALLMPTEERRKIAHEHISDNGKRTRDEGKGIFGRDEKKRHEDSLTALEAQGRMPWQSGERAYFVELCQNPEYRHQSGKVRGKPDYARIAVELEATFGIPRTPHALGNAWNREKARSKQATQSA